MATHKKKFLNIKFKPNKTLVEFLDHFYQKAQILVGARSMTDFNLRITMEHVIKMYKDLHILMIPVYNDRNCDTKKLVYYLIRCSTSIEIPRKAHREKRFRSNKHRSFKKNDFGKANPNRNSYKKNEEAFPVLQLWKEGTQIHKMSLKEED